MINDNFEHLEKDVMKMLLEGDDPTVVILRSQLKHSKRICTEMTGTGFFTYFKISPEALRLPNNVRLRFGDVSAEIEGIKHGAGFVLFVDDGILTTLEGFTYDEQWPEVIESYKLTFMGKPCRDWNLLRKTPGWPA